MRKFRTILAAFVCSLAFFTNANAQTNKDFYVGKWNILVVGTPNGDTKMDINLERVDGKLKGNISDPVTGKAGAALDKVEETDKGVTVYFMAGTIKVYVYMEKSDENHVTGSLMDMFDMTGERVVKSDN